MAHTPGPWKQFPPGTIVGHSGQAVIKREGDFDWVASVQIANSPNWEANARLIAAAPLMLEALEAIELGLDYGGELLTSVNPERMVALVTAQEAIRAAKGEA